MNWLSWLLSLVVAECVTMAERSAETKLRFRNSSLPCVRPRRAWVGIGSDGVRMVPRPVLTSWADNRQYGIVIDAGSSGSRVQIYSWLDPALVLSLKQQAKQSADSLTKVEKGVQHGDGWHLKVEPGAFSPSLGVTHED